MSAKQKARLGIEDARASSRHQRRHPASLPEDVELIGWAADQLGIGESTAYRLAAQGQVPGAFKVGGQWRVSVPKFRREVHGNREGS